MGMSNSSVAHDFFYKGVARGVAKEYMRCAVSYRGRDCYSYSTIIAKVVPAKGMKEKDIDPTKPGSGVLLLTFDRMSASTGKHRSEVSGANPFSSCVDVPMKFGRRDFTPEELRMRFLDELERYAQDLNHAESRQKFIWLLNARNEVIARACETWAKPLRAKRFEKYEAMREKIADYAKKLQERARKMAAKKAAETKAVVAKYLGDGVRRGKDYVDFIFGVFGRPFTADWDLLPEKYRAMTDDERKAVRNALDCGSHAYVWIEGENLRTSRNVTVPVREARVAMRAWALGKDMRTFKVGPYQIVKYEGSVIQIGCHPIPRENMLALYEVLMGEPFGDPGRKAAA